MTLPSVLCSEHMTGKLWVLSEADPSDSSIFRNVISAVSIKCHPLGWWAIKTHSHTSLAHSCPCASHTSAVSCWIMFLFPLHSFLFGKSASLQLVSETSHQLWLLGVTQSSTSSSSVSSSSSSYSFLFGWEDPGGDGGAGLRPVDISSERWGLCGWAPAAATTVEATLH